MATSDAGEALFYHLEQRPLEGVLPTLVERTLERGWHAIIQAGSDERVSALDALLWTYRDDSFLPHGTSSDGPADKQPIFLTTNADNPNSAEVRFLIDGAQPDTFAGYTRLVFLFDGHDPDAVAKAREQWQEASTAGCQVTYWQQSVEGRWEKKA